MINVNVIFSPDSNTLWQKRIKLPKGATLEHALVHSGFYKAHKPCWHEAPCGVYGIIRDRNYPLEEGDQVEIYRALVFNPMESRRRRAAHKQRKLNKKQKHRRQPSAAAKMILNQE